MGETIRNRLDEEAFVIEPVLELQSVEVEQSLANDQRFVNGLTQMIHGKRRTMDAAVGSSRGDARRKSTLEIGQDLGDVTSNGLTPLHDDLMQPLRPVLPTMIMRIPEETVKDIRMSTAVSSTKTDRRRNVMAALKTNYECFIQDSLAEPTRKDFFEKRHTRASSQLDKTDYLHSLAPSRNRPVSQLK